MNTYLHSNGSLEIRKVETTDNDRYRCIATNPAGTITRQIQLNVNSKYSRLFFFFNAFFFCKVPPWIIGTEKETTVQTNIGKSITLVCPVVGTPKPTIQWFKDDQLLQSFDFNDQYVLTNIKRNDQGVYRCLATNKAGSTDRLFNLSVHSERELIFLLLK
jgi:hemicentin